MERRERIGDAEKCQREELQNTERMMNKLRDESKLNINSDAEEQKDVTDM